MTKAERHRYYASREWALLKKQVRERSGGRCERCGEGDYEQTHHLTYERMGHELLEDLQAVCAPCHEYISGMRAEDPMAKHSTQYVAHVLPDATASEVALVAAVLGAKDPKGQAVRVLDNAGLFLSSNVEDTIRSIANGASQIEEYPVPEIILAARKFPSLSRISVDEAVRMAAFEMIVTTGEGSPFEEIRYIAKDYAFGVILSQTVESASGTAWEYMRRSSQEYSALAARYSGPMRSQRSNEEE